ATEGGGWRPSDSGKPSPVCPSREASHYVDQVICRVESKTRSASKKDVNVNDRIRADLNGLGRLLASENSATDLLALLIDLDAEPVNTLFDLPGDESYVAEREVQTQGKGRLDLVLRGTDSNMIRAALEMKGASSIHG